MNDLTSLIQEGIEINREMKEKEARLSEIKKILRQEAEARRTGFESPVELATEDEQHVVSISFPSDRMALKKGVDPDKMFSIKNEMGDMVFGIFFKEKVSFTVDSEFEQNIEKVQDPLQKQALENIVEKKVSTPRVSFPK